MPSVVPTAVSSVSDAAPVAVFVDPPSAETQVSVYSVIGRPPLSVGALKDTVILLVVALCDVMLGAPGFVKGVPAALGADSRESPAAFVALTDTVYDTPFVSPVSTQDSVTDTQLAPPGCAVAVYDVMGDQPLFAGAAQFAVIVLSPMPDRVTFDGGSGVVYGVSTTTLVAAVGKLYPIAFLARTDTVYVSPGVSPVIWQVLPEDKQLAPPGCAVAV